jgi:hypothetical protein
VPLVKRTNLILATLFFVATATVTLWHNAHIAVLWDLSYLLDSSYRIALGQHPYRDFPFAHAPLTFLIQAAIIRLTGRMYLHHVLYAALAGATATVLTQRILLRLLQDKLRRPTLIANLLTTPLIFLGIYSIYPHPIYDSDAALSVLLALYLLQCITSASPLRCLFAGAALIPPLFFKQNIGLLFLVATMAVIVVLAISTRLQRRPIQPYLWIATGTATTLALALLILHLTVGLHNYFYWTITFAAQRRLPGIGAVLSPYHQASLLWTVPPSIAALILLRQKYRWIKPAAILLLAAPFLYTLGSLCFTDDMSDRADQLLALWPHLLVLSILLALFNLRRRPTFHTLLPVILLATIHATFLSQQLWGSTYAIWPFLILLIALLLVEVPTIATPLTAILTATLLICGTRYSLSHERLSYTQLTGTPTTATLPQLRGLHTPGPWLPNFEELVRDTNRTIPNDDTILLLPGQDPFYYATGRTPRFSVLLFDPATNPYSPQQLAEQAVRQNVRWLIVNRTLQLNEFPLANHADYLAALQSLFTLHHSLANYDIYIRK